MTLQYRPRSLWEDRLWFQRVRLAELLILDTVDWWCRKDLEFPIQQTIGGFLFLFSPRCAPFDIPERSVRQYLQEHAKAPLDEYALAWPNKSIDTGDEIVGDLTGKLRSAVDRWSSEPIASLAPETVTEDLVGCIVARGFVVFRHFKTTRRDGGFFGNG